MQRNKCHNKRGYSILQRKNTAQGKQTAWKRRLAKCLHPTSDPDYYLLSYTCPLLISQMTHCMVLETIMGLGKWTTFPAKHEQFVTNHHTICGSQFDSV
jgi:hypothetical protein